MTKIDNSGNLNKGESTEGQDKGNTGESSSNSWEQQAKYFQSEKDKLHQENSKLKKYEKIGKFLESRPDAAQAVANVIKGGQPTQTGPVRVEKPKDFDPWEAYNDPKSDSYRYRQQEMKDAINGAVGQATSKIEQNQGVAQLQNQLQQRGMNQEQITSFMEFASKNPADYGLEAVINMWDTTVNGAQQVEQQQPPNAYNEFPSPLDVVKDVQNTPATGGILQGQSVQAKSDEDSLWEAIKGTTMPGGKLP
jgi:SOS response regulatory protein OraA/RecX